MKKITNYSKFSSIFFLQAYANFFPFFSITKEFHHLHKTMGQGTISPWHNEHDEPTTTPKGSKW